MKRPKSALPGRATIKDVARLAGVSSATVSYVLNNLGKVTPEVDAQVRKAADTIGYRRNSVATALKTGRRNVIGCIFPTLTSPVFPEILQAIQHRAEQLGFATFVVESGRGEGREEEAAQVMAQHGVDGVIAVLDRKPKISDNPRYPIVVIDRRVRGLDSVEADHERGGQLMAEFAFSLGHRQVGLLSGLQDLESSQQRRKGFLDAAKGKLHVVWESEVPLTAQLPDAANRLINERRVTLLACVNDLVAMGALGALRQAGIRVPKDVSVIGFDNIQWTSWPLIDLTTIHQSLSALGETAVDLLVKRLEHPQREAEHLKLPVSLIERGTTAARQW